MSKDDKGFRSMYAPCYNYPKANMSAVLVFGLPQTIIDTEQACMRDYLFCRTLGVADLVDCDNASKILLLGILLFAH